MTVDNCVMLLEKYKKQMEDPRHENGAPYTGDQRKHAVERSKRNYEAMKKRILTSPKFIGGTVKLVDGRVKTFDRHPIVDTLMDRPKEEPVKKKKEEVKDGNH